MTSRDLSRLMWSEALTLLEQADRLHRQFCRPAAAAAPVGSRPWTSLKPRTRSACTWRCRVWPLIPYGRFQRRIGLPTQALTLAEKILRDGCLTLTFSKKKESP